MRPAPTLPLRAPLRRALRLSLRLSLLVPLCISILAHTAAAKTHTVWVTPHASFSSSIGVLGCKVDTDRIAYWPIDVDCDNICVALTYADRTVHLLRVDQSEGAYDVSYDAWNYLYTGYAATDKPTAGGAIEMTYEPVDPSNCDDLIHTKGKKLPLSASNSMNYVASCLDQNDTYVGDNYVLYNIADSLCTMGFDETCDLDYPTYNQASCPHTLGLAPVLNNTPVYNIMYPTGEKVLASTGEVVSDTADDTTNADEDSPAPIHTPAFSLMLLTLASCLLYAS
ncbi:hypothetical protein G7Z17_g864 [Cylindrodendrum hubeiense]|uniref:Cerato-platanin n=1 Tax=Cylindrodendrum hubeiense TaxID=595255 RepID=A0A9P5HJH7_9HYPO|nr:hypothetical protein G7Z17_g864 [Cylindrodendrum hubeiense]